MEQIEVIARDPHLADDDENALQSVFYNEDCTVWYVTKSLYEHDGLEFNLKATIEEHHGEEFVESYGDILVNDSRVLQMDLREISGNFLAFFCDEQYPGVEGL